MDIWTWFVNNTAPNELVTNLGIGTFLILFATNRILTLGQHNSRIAELKDHHTRELAQKDSAYEAMVLAKDTAYDEMKESRNYYRGARLEEKNRADKATEQLVESNEIARAATHALTALSTVAQEASHDQA